MTYPFVQSYTDLGVAKGPRLAITWHMAEGGGTVGYLAKPNPNGVSVHFVIEYTGRIVQMLKLTHMQSSIRTSDIRTTNDAAYGNPPVMYGRAAALAVMGKWADISHGTLGPNHASIGVECEGFAAAGLNEKQAASAGLLFADMTLQFPGIRSLGHRDFQDYKPCPGKHFPWDQVDGHGPDSPSSEDPMIVPIQFGHVVTTTAAHVYTAPDLGAQTPSTLPTGTRVRKFGGVPGWQFVQVNYGGIQQLVWLKSSDIDGDALPLTIIDGPLPPAGDCTAEIAADRAKAKIVYS